VKVLIPVYKRELSALEKRSLQQAYTVLKAYPLIIIKPESLDISQLIENFPLINYQSFDDAFFSGIEGYNKLMLSTLFYERFLDTQYMLIYQLDAYVFKDELTEWCNCGYDYIGAPWLKKPLYDLPVVSWMMKCSLKYHACKGSPSKQMLYNKVGNGGFSLRKIKSHYQAIGKYETEINYYLSQKRCHLFNEDVFWATRPEFSYPDVTEALRFAFDKYPRLSYKRTNGELPFGCHSWYKRKMKQFWKPVIKF
jgi:hypothetical protein